MNALPLPIPHPARTRWSLRILTLALLALLMMAATGCVSMDEHKRLQTAFDQARAQLAEAENDLNVARAKIAELDAKIADLNRLLEQNGGLGALKQERDLLARQLAELQAKYKDLLDSMANKPVLPEDINAQLRRLADKYPDLLEFDERLGMVRFKSDLTFDLGSTEVKPRAKQALGEFAKILNDPLIAQQEITVMGHTDDVPIRKTSTMQMNPTNWILSTNRGWAVADVLRNNGVSEARVSSSGWGDQRPISPNAPGKKGSEKNRRVDVYIRPTKVPEGITVSSPGAARSATPAPTTHRPAAPGAPRAPARTGPTTAPAPELPPSLIPG
jgi:chemotaxis protein MotB